MRANQYCQKHYSEIRCICTEDNFEDDRRFCVECLNGQTCYDLNIFREKVISVFHNVKKTEGFKADFEQIRIKFEWMLMDLQRQLEKVIQMIDKEDSEIYDLKKDLLIYDKHILDFKPKSLNRMVQMINGPYTDYVKKKQMSQRETVENTIKQISGFIDDCCDRVKILSSTVQINEQNNVRLEVSSLLGIKHGESYYLNENGSKEYAGSYVFEEKEGLWKQQIKQDLFEFVVFQKGKIVNYVQEFGKKNKNGKKEGKQLEKFGDYNQLKNFGYFTNGVEYGHHEIFFNGKKWQKKYQFSGEGEYNSKGQKINYWIEPKLNYDTNLQIQFKGSYVDGKKFGKWQTFENDQLIFEGEYGMDGQKQGKWVEFENKSNFIWEGNYQNSIRFGRWNLYSLKQNTQIIGKKSLIDLNNADLIGGGCYNYAGEKTGEWLEKASSLDYHYKGYYDSGKKIGFWVICKQIPLFPWDVNLYNELQIFLQTKKENTIFSRGDFNHTIVSRNPFYSSIVVKIHGGFYDKNQLKQGFWVEPQIVQKNEILYCGEYLDNQRVGYWRASKTSCLSFIEFESQQSEYGLYDQNGRKQGNWTEFDDSFTIILFGQYQNGKRVGYWGSSSLYFCNLGGNYDNEGLKTDLWTEIKISKQGYNCIKIGKGQYLKGKRIGFWTFKLYLDKDILSNMYQQLKQGNYNQAGKKDGLWAKLNSNTNELECEYSAGKKIRNWCSKNFQKNIIQLI